MLVAAALCAHPPLLVPEIASGAASELDDLRAACDAVVAELLSARPDRIVVVGNGPVSAGYGPGAVADLGRYGVRPAGARPGAESVGSEARSVGAERLPLPLGIGGWLLERADGGVARQYVAISSDTSPDQVARIGAEAVAGPERVALLAMGDGSARRTESSPGPFHPDAEPFDTRVSTALRTPDPAALLAIEEGTCQELWAGGRIAWQALAGVLDPAVAGKVRYDAAPYGVGYLVISWLPA